MKGESTRISLTTPSRLQEGKGALLQERLHLQVGPTSWQVEVWKTTWSPEKYGKWEKHPKVFNKNMVENMGKSNEKMVKSYENNVNC